MRNLIFILGLILAVFLNACQENTITDPITDNNLEKNSSYYTNLNNGKIKLDEELLDPSQNPGTSFNIQGTIDYAVRSIENSVSAEAAYNSIVKMKINAILQPNALIDVSSSFHNYKYIVYKETVDYIDLRLLGTRNDNTLVKRYAVSGCSNRIYLECKFTVTTTKIMLNEIKLCCDRQIVNLVTD